jgi:hypothetical protein
VIDTRFTVADNAKIFGKGGVTLVINGNYEMIIGDGVSLAITAPTKGAYAGLAIFSKRDASAVKTHKFGKTLRLDISGALYFPNQILELKSSLSGINGCAQALARVVRVENSVMLGSNCSGLGTRLITGSTSYLVQ